MKRKELKRVDLLSMMNDEELKLIEEFDYESEMKKVVNLTNELENNRVEDTTEMEDIMNTIDTLLEDLEDFESIKEHLYYLQDIAREQNYILEKKNKKKQSKTDNINYKNIGKVNFNI